MKKTLTGPAWFLLAFGLLYTLGSIASLYRYLHMVQLVNQQKASPLFIIRYFLPQPFSLSRPFSIGASAAITIFPGPPGPIVSSC